MKIKFGLYFLLPLISVVTFNNSFAQEHEPGKTFSASQEKRIGEIAADYLRAHPEILIQMSEKLQHEQEAKQTGRNDFLSLGEVFETSTPYHTEGESKLIARCTGGP